MFCMIVGEVRGMFGQKVCEKYDVCLEELRLCSRRNVVVQGRGAMQWIVVREFSYYGADVTVYLGVTNSCVTRMISASLSYSNTELSKRMASATFSGTSSLDKKPAWPLCRRENRHSMPCSIRAHAQDRPAPAAFYELFLHTEVSYFIIISIYFRNL